KGVRLADAISRASLPPLRRPRAIAHLPKTSARRARRVSCEIRRPYFMKSSFVLLALAVGIGACSSKEEAPDPYATVGQFCLAWGKSACTSEAVSACA